MDRQTEDRDRVLAVLHGVCLSWAFPILWYPSLQHTEELPLVGRPDVSDWAEPRGPRALGGRLASGGTLSLRDSVTGSVSIGFVTGRPPLGHTLAPVVC